MHGTGAGERGSGIREDKTFQFDMGRTTGCKYGVGELAVKGEVWRLREELSAVRQVLGVFSVDRLTTVLGCGFEFW